MVAARLSARDEQALHPLRVLYRLTERASASRQAAEIFEAALDALEEGLRVDRASILLFDDDGVMRFRAWRRLSEGYRAAVEGHSPWTRDEQAPRPVLVPDVLQDAALASLGPVILGEGIRSLAFVPLVEGGELLGKFMLYYDAPRAYSDDDVRLAQAIAHHVAEAFRRQSVADALAAQNERYSALLTAQNDLGDGILLAENRRVAWANEAFERITGYSLREMRAPGWSLATLATAASAPVFERKLAAREAGQGQDRFEAELRRRDGSIAEVEISAKGLGEPPRHVFIAIVRDVTERRARERELEQARRQLAVSEKLTALGTLVNGVAHELRTPLASLSNSLHLARMRTARAGGAGEEVEQLFAAAEEDIDRINRLVLSLRRFTRGDAQDAARLPLGSAVQRAVDLFESAYRGRLRIETTIDAGAAGTLVQPDFQQVVINLLENAADASDAMVAPCVRVAVRVREGAAELVVRDEGAGIPRELQARVFDPFFTTKKDGTGLGLSIVRRICESHGASIALESAPGEGTTFVVRLPDATRARGAPAST